MGRVVFTGFGRPPLSARLLAKGSSDQEERSAMGAVLAPCAELVEPSSKFEVREGQGKMVKLGEINGFQVDFKWYSGEDGRCSRWIWISMGEVLFPLGHRP